jgi:DNA-binding response OmpR family regulator
MNPYSNRRILVLSDNQAVARMIELLAGQGVQVVKAVMPFQCLPGEGWDREDLDLVIVALSSPASEPLVMLARARVTPRIGRVPILIISDKPFESDPDTRITYLNFPFDVDLLGQRIRAILSANSNDGSTCGPSGMDKENPHVTRTGLRF